MNNLKKTTLTCSFLIATLIGTAPAQAAKISTAGQANSACKAQAEKAHPDYKHSRSIKIKQARGVFKIKMRIVTETETITTLCDVTRDGEITYVKA